MAKQKVDGVIEAVRYKADGEVLWARVFLRRGPAWSDRILIERKDLIQAIQGGKKFFAGSRQEFMGGSFDIGEPVKVLSKDGKDMLVTGEGNAQQDRLDGVPRL